MRPAYLLSCFLVGSAVSASLAGAATGATFLREELSARPMGLAGNYVAWAEGVDGLGWNPAGLAFSQGTELSGSYLKNVADASQFFLGVAHHDGWGGLAFNIRASQAGTAEVLSPGGSLRTVRAEDAYILTGSYALALFDHLGLGVSGKWITSTLAEQATATAWAGDLGLLWKEGDWTVGGAIQNFGTTFTYVSQSDVLPLLGRAGITWRTVLDASHALLFTAEANKVLNDTALPWRVGGGVEWQAFDLLALRAGYQYSTSGDTKAFGLGVHWQEWRLDFALAQVPGEVSKTYFTLSWRAP